MPLFIEAVVEDHLMGSWSRILGSKPPLMNFHKDALYKRALVIAVTITDANVLVQRFLQVQLQDFLRS